MPNGRLHQLSNPDSDSSEPALREARRLLKHARALLDEPAPDTFLGRERQRPCRPDGRLGSFTLSLVHVSRPQQTLVK
jgi:hypothetical protein